MKYVSVTTNQKRCIKLLTESDVDFNLCIRESQANNRQYSYSADCPTTSKHNCWLFEKRVISFK